MMRRKIYFIILIMMALAFGRQSIGWVQEQEETKISGEITEIDGDKKMLTVKVSGEEEREENILTDESTRFKEKDKDISFEDLKVGDKVEVVGRRNEEGNILAREVIKE